MSTILTILFGGLALMACYVAAIMWPDSAAVALFILLFSGFTGYTIGRNAR